MRTKIALTLLAITLFAFASAGGHESEGKECDSGLTHKASDDDTCVPCDAAQAAHAEGCSLCSRHSARCELCLDNWYNQGIEGQPCIDNTGGTALPNCAATQRHFSPNHVGCARCAETDPPQMPFYDAANNLYKCTNCGGDRANCGDCGNKDVTNCNKCHSVFGCAECSGNFMFNHDDTHTTVDGHGFGVCQSCKHAFQGPTCDTCEEGYHNIDGHCIEVNEAMCGGQVIPGCNECGTQDPTKCAKCATGYGPFGTGPEFDSCMTCGQGCSACHMENLIFKKCSTCLPNMEHPDDQDWCKMKMPEMPGNAKILSYISLALLSLFFFRF